MWDFIPPSKAVKVLMGFYTYNPIYNHIKIKLLIKISTYIKNFPK